MSKEKELYLCLLTKKEMKKLYGRRALETNEVTRRFDPEDWSCEVCIFKKKYKIYANLADTQTVHFCGKTDLFKYLNEQFLPEEKCESTVRGEHLNSSGSIGVFLEELGKCPPEKEHPSDIKQEESSDSEESIPAVDTESLEDTDGMTIEEIRKKAEATDVETIKECNSQNLRIAELAEKGTAVAVIADEVGLSYEATRSRLKELGYHYNFHAKVWENSAE